ncbi:hypothetical protein [Niallia nealsonii]|nr:hypothetical protein [Niallia nealsonii]
MIRAVTSTTCSVVKRSWSSRFGLVTHTSITISNCSFSSLSDM